MRPTELRPLSECESNLSPCSIRLSYAMRERPQGYRGVMNQRVSCVIRAWRVRRHRSERDCTFAAAISLALGHDNWDAPAAGLQPPIAMSESSGPNSGCAGPSNKTIGAMPVALLGQSPCQGFPVIDAPAIALLEDLTRNSQRRAYLRLRLSLACSASRTLR